MYIYIYIYITDQKFGITLIFPLNFKNKSSFMSLIKWMFFYVCMHLYYDSNQMEYKISITLIKANFNLKNPPQPFITAEQIIGIFSRNM